MAAALLQFRRNDCHKTEVCYQARSICVLAGNSDLAQQKVKRVG